MVLPNRTFLFLCFPLSVRICCPQTTGATFGEIINLGGTPSDIVLDESMTHYYRDSFGCSSTG
jgi:hypothetical protein